MSRNNLSAFIDAYFHAALWSSTYGENGEHSLDDGKHEIADETCKTMRADCKAFWLANETLLDPENCIGNYAFAEQAGHDFWLARCHHGSGFWDGDWREPAATQLTDAAHAFGNVDLYVGDDGRIYA